LVEGADDLPPLEEDGEGVPPICKQYQNDADVFGYCLYKVAGGLPDASELDRICTMAGSWEADCRHAWVAGRMRERSMPLEELAEACAGNPDCTFELVDFYADDDVLVQLENCGKWVQPYLTDCVGHAMQRWYHTEPDEEEHARVIGTPLAEPHRTAHYLAANVQCRGVGSCEAVTSPVQQSCEKSVEHFQKKPDDCPREKQPLFPDAGPSSPNLGQQGQTPQGGRPQGGQPPADRPAGQQGGQGRPKGLPPGTPPPSNNGG